MSNRYSGSFLHKMDSYCMPDKAFAFVDTVRIGCCTEHNCKGNNCCNIAESIVDNMES